MAWKASGATNLALGERDRDWDQGVARRHIFEWAGWEDHPNPGQARKAFLAYDDETPTNITAYKMPFADVIDGELRAMPRGLFAVAQMLEGARDGVDVPESVLRAIRRKVTAYYRKMGDTPPWQEKGNPPKSMPGKMGPGKHRKSKRAAQQAARTRKGRGTQSHGARHVSTRLHKTRQRAARTAAEKRKEHARA